MPSVHLIFRSIATRELASSLLQSATGLLARVASVRKPSVRDVVSAFVVENDAVDIWLFRQVGQPVLGNLASPALIGFDPRVGSRRIIPIAATGSGIGLDKF